MIFGLIIIVIGVLLLLQHFGLITGDVWSVFWPVVLILAGLVLVLGRKHNWQHYSPRKK